MVNVELYKLKKTVDPAVREYGMFEFFGMVDGPLPQNYVREWAGELPIDNLDTLCGKLFLNPPDGYYAGPLEKSDIVVVNGEAYFLDRESGYKFVDVNFDTKNIKDAVHVDYGYYVDTRGSVTISNNIVEICDELDVPFGYFSEPDYHGSHKGESAFYPSPSQTSHAQAYLHPQFLKDAEARAFIDLLKELSMAERWTEIKEYLIESYPVYHQDLEKAREQYAPELLLPAELRPLSMVIPGGADKEELDCLANKIKSMDSDQRTVFEAAVEAGRHCGSIVDLINLTENLDRFELQPAFSAEQYGEFLLEMEKDNTSAVFDKLEHSEYLDEREMAQYILRLEAYIDAAAYGRGIAAEENGTFTMHGYLTEKDGSREVYRSSEVIPDEHHTSRLSREKAADEVQVIAPGIRSDEMLGRFLYDNKMLSKEQLQAANARLSFTAYPEEHYRMMGKRRREARNGTFTDAGYVEKHQSAELPSVLGRIAADRAERAAPSNRGVASDKTRKSRSPEL